METFLIVTREILQLPYQTYFSMAYLQMIYPTLVSESLKKSIVSWKYVNLAALLVPDNDAFKSTESIVELELLKQQQRDHRLHRVLSITQFYMAFGIH